MLLPVSDEFIEQVPVRSQQTTHTSYTTQKSSENWQVNNVTVSDQFTVAV